MTPPSMKTKTPSLESEMIVKKKAMSPLMLSHPPLPGLKPAPAPTSPRSSFYDLGDIQITDKNGNRIVDTEDEISSKGQCLVFGSAKVQDFAEKIGAGTARGLPLRGMDLQALKNYCTSLRSIEATSHEALAADNAWGFYAQLCSLDTFLKEAESSAGKIGIAWDARRSKAQLSDLFEHGLEMSLSVALQGKDPGKAQEWLSYLQDAKKILGSYLNSGEFSAQAQAKLEELFARAVESAYVLQVEDKPWDAQRLLDHSETCANLIGKPFDKPMHSFLSNGLTFMFHVSFGPFELNNDNFLP